MRNRLQCVSVGTHHFGDFLQGEVTETKKKIICCL